MRRLPTLAAALAAGALLAPDASAATKMPAVHHRFTWSGQGCTEGVALISVPAERLAKHVPAPFTPSLMNGGTTIRLLLGAMECESLVVNGVRQPGGLFADAGIVVTDADGKAAAYHLWQVTDAASLRRRMAALGMRGDVSNRLAAPFDQVAAASVASGTVDWREGEYGIDVVGANPTNAPLSSADWWHKGPKGLIRTRFTFSPRVQKTGASTVTTTAASSLGQLLGADAAAGQGLVVERHDVVADVATQR